VSLSEELERIAGAASGHAAEGEELAAVIPAEPAGGIRVYLCAFSSRDSRTWLALDHHGQPITDRSLVRDAASIAALCELAEECAAELDDLEEAPRVASPAYLDAIGAGARGREQGPGSPFAEAMKRGSVAVEGVTVEVEDKYKLPLS